MVAPAKTLSPQHRYHAVRERQPLRHHGHEIGPQLLTDPWRLDLDYIELRFVVAAESMAAMAHSSIENA
jgi:hypothetical protein